MRNLSFIFSNDQFVEYIEWLKKKEFDIISKDDAYKMYDQMLDEIYQWDNLQYSMALKQQDPIQYQCGFNDWISNNTFDTMDPMFDSSQQYYMRESSLYTCEDDVVDLFIESEYPEVHEIIKNLKDIPTWAKYYSLEDGYVAIKDKRYEAVDGEYRQQFTLKKLVGKI